LGKKTSEKSAKKHFLYSHEYRDQKWGEGENARNNFSTNTRIVRRKNVGEKIDGKKCEKAFFIFARISYQKNGGKKPAKQFFKKHTNTATKKVGKKIVGKKVRKRVFYIRTITETKIWGEKTRETIFQKHKNSATKK